MIFWRKRSESQRIKAEIAWLHHTQPELSQRAIAARLHCSQPYVCEVLKSVRQMGVEEALGPEAYEIYKALRNAELTKRHEALVAESQRSRCETTPPRESHPADQAEMASQEGPTEYVELVRTTNDELIELRGSRPYQPQPPTPQPPQQASNCRWVKGTVAAVVPIDLSQVDSAPLAFARMTSRDRSNSWF